jgi:hypothetical protein
VSESDFAKEVTRALALHGRRVLRAADYRDARHGVFGLRALTDPTIDSTGADYLVLPRDGMQCVVARSWDDVKAMAMYSGAYFLELKDPKARSRKDQLEQDEWIRWVRGERRRSAIEKAMGER